MNGKQGRLLVAGDYGASDEDSDSEDVPPTEKGATSNNAITVTHSVTDGSPLNVNFERHDMNSAWSVLYDQVSGYPYYWNSQSNEVRWDKPLELEEAANSTSTRQFEERNGAKDVSKQVFKTFSNATTSTKSASRSFDEQFARSKLSKTHKAKSSKNCKANGTESLVFIGPSLPPEEKPENLALQKVKHFEANLASTLIAEIDEESPLDWNSPFSSTINDSECAKDKRKSSHGPSPIYSNTFSWKTTEPLIPMVNEIEQTFVTKSLGLKNPAHPIAIIAHGYGDEEDSDNDNGVHTSSKEELKNDFVYSNKLASQCDNRQSACDPKQKSPRNSRKRKIEMKVKKSSKIAQDTTAQNLPPAAAIFQESEYTSDEENTAKELVDCDKEKNIDGVAYNESEQQKSVTDECNKNNWKDNSTCPTNSKIAKLDKQQSKSRKGFDAITGPTYKKSIDNIAEMLCDKLEALEVHAIDISPLKLLAIQIETLFEAWHNGALSAGYMQKFLAKMQGEMSHLEAQELAPPGWRAIWNRSFKKYKYESLITGEIQDERPTEDEEEIEELKSIEFLQGSSGTQVISSLNEKFAKRTGTKSNLPDVASNQHEYPKETLPTAELSPALPFPPLPPLPPEDPTNGDASVGPPLPSEDNPSDLDHLSNQPPPPPPEALPSEKSDQINTSTSQVQDMELSDGDEGCESGEVHTHTEKIEKELPVSESASTISSSQMTSSQIVAGNIVYNNQPHIYQNYYQNYQQIFPGQLPTGVSKDTNETSINPLNDALTSFYSDLASIDTSSDVSLRDGGNDIYNPSITESSEIIASNTNNTQTQGQMADVEISGHNHQSTSNIGDSITSEDRTDSPRELTPERRGQEEKEKRKKKAKLTSGLSMKKKGVSNLVAKWQNIQEESSRHRPQ